MRKLTLLLIVTSYSLVMTGCSQKQCPKLYYPTIVAIDKIKKNKNITYREDGSLSIEDGQKLGRMVKSFFIMQDYYYDSIVEYTILKRELEEKYNEKS